MRPPSRPDPLDILSDRLEVSIDDRRQMDIITREIKGLRKEIGGEKRYIRQSDLFKRGAEE